MKQKMFKDKWYLSNFRILIISMVLVITLQKFIGVFDIQSSSKQSIIEAASLLAWLFLALFIGRKQSRFGYVFTCKVRLDRSVIIPLILFLGHFVLYTRKIEFLIDRLYDPVRLLNMLYWNSFFCIELTLFLPALCWKRSPVKAFLILYLVYTLIQLIELTRHNEQTISFVGFVRYSNNWLMYAHNILRFSSIVGPSLSSIVLCNGNILSSALLSTALLRYIFLFDDVIWDSLLLKNQPFTPWSIIALYIWTVFLVFFLLNFLVFTHKVSNVKIMQKQSDIL